MVQHFDVIIIGAGISGIDAAYHLQKLCPRRTYRILERREQLGGTWDLFRYPGVRSDSDMFTFAYNFKAWESPRSLAAGGEILAYLQEVVQDSGILGRIAFSTHVVRASWSTPAACWSLTSDRGEAFSCSFLVCCGGYYDYDEPHQPDFPGRERFPGPVIHPQFWGREDDACYQNKRVAIIGSGATAVTLLPNLAKGGAEHVTMVQRTPSYMLATPATDGLAQALGRRLPGSVSHPIIRMKNALSHAALFSGSRSFPGLFKRMLLKQAWERLQGAMSKEEFERHFTPPYNPWEQRLCVLPQGDLFSSIKEGRASVATGRIESFTERGIQLEGGQHVDADVIVTATGLSLQQNYPMSTMEVTVDGEPYDPTRTLVYMGLMLSGVPNFAFTLGYANTSWTLKADITSAFVCRLLNHMERQRYGVCRPRPDASVKAGDGMLSLTSGYVERAKARMPRHGDRAPWRLPNNYFLDRLQMGLARLEGAGLEFSPGPARL